jgi:hypothetical protein
MSSNKTIFPFYVGEPRKMHILEQVLCMVWLASNKTLRELRIGQSMIEQQFATAIKKRLPETTFADLHAMMDNYTAAVAYQTFTDIDTWMAFINEVPEV